MGIKVTSNVSYKDRKGIRITMKDGAKYFIGYKEAEELGHLLLASTGKMAVEIVDITIKNQYTEK